MTEERRRARNRAKWRRRLTVLAFMSPWLVGFTVFFGYPLVSTVYLSFTHYDLLKPARWIGLANYKYMFSDDKQIWPAVRNTLWLVVFAVPLKVMFAFGIATMLTRARSGIGIFRTIFYLPALAPPVAATLGFVYLLNPATGPVNQVLSAVGIDGPLWFNDPHWSKPALTLLLMWGVGNLMIIFLAALIDVPRHLYESAELDGAGAWQRLRWVTLPTISPVLLFAVVIGTIEALQIFDQAYVGATIAAGSASSAGDPVQRPRLPRGLDAVLSRAAVPAGLPLLQHGLRGGDGGAAARRLARDHAGDRAQLAALGPLRGGPLR